MRRAWPRTPGEPLGSTVAITRPVRDRPAASPPETGRAPSPEGAAPPGAEPFVPYRPLLWTVLTVLAVAAMAGLGVLLCRCLAPFIEWSLVTLAARPMQPWVAPCLMAGFILYLVSVLFPFLLFLCWGRLSRPQRPKGTATTYWPFVSIVIPAHNEQEIILDAVHGA